MKADGYSSLTAFLAHYRALSAAARSDGDGLSSHERVLLAAMEQAFAALSREERTALLAESDDGTQSASALARRRARAELRLRRMLIARTLLQP